MDQLTPAITVEKLSKSFKLPHEQHSGIKQLIVNFYKRKKGYETQQVLDNISFQVNKGEFFGIVGRNGSGKSTLLKLLAGIYSPEKGSVQIYGSLTPFIELGVGFNFELTGRENVYMNGALLGFSNAQMNEMYDDIVEFAELEKFMDQKLKNYSSGMQVRLAFSIAIRADTDILVLDEVLAVGDAAFQQKCFNYFEELKKLNKTVVLVTHDMSAVQRFCSRALFLEKGEIKRIGSTSEIADMYIADNIRRNDKRTQKKHIKENPNKLFLSIDKRDSDNILSFDYHKQDSGKSVYVGFSILKDGFTVAEINNSTTPSSDNNGKFDYRLSTKEFNAGAYEVVATLFDDSGRRPMAQTEKRASFVVKGADSRRGGAMFLKDTWL